MSDTPTEPAKSVPASDAKADTATVLPVAASQESGQQQGAITEVPYKVGPGKPPLETRWKAGGPSPNPKGRTPEVMSKEEIIHEARKYGPEAIETVVALMRNGLDGKTAGKMALALLGIGHDIGPGAQRKESSASVSVNITAGALPLDPGSMTSQSITEFHLGRRNDTDRKSGHELPQAIYPWHRWTEEQKAEYAIWQAKAQTWGGQEPDVAP